MNIYTDAETRLMQFMQDQGFDNDIAIKLIYDMLYPHGDATESRMMQQYIGSLISRLNKKLTVYKIVPGKLKRTYRITAVT